MRTAMLLVLLAGAPPAVFPAAATAPRYLPGRLAELRELGVLIRRPVGFEPDPTAPDDGLTLERQRGTDAFGRQYRTWFLALRRHTGFADLKAVRTSWAKYVSDEKSGWEVALTPALRFDGLEGLLAVAVPRDHAEPGGLFTAAVLLGSGRLFEVRLDVLSPVSKSAGQAFVEDFLRAAVLDRARLGPLRVLAEAGCTLRLPRGWTVPPAEAPALLVTAHPEGPERGQLAWRLVERAAEPGELLHRALAGRLTEAEPRDVGPVESGSARLAVTADGDLVAAVRQEARAFVIEGRGTDRAALESAVVRALQELRPADLEALVRQADARAAELRSALAEGDAGEAPAIAAVEALGDLLDLPPARALVDRTLSSAPPRVQEAMIRALGARADALTTPALSRTARALGRKNEPATLAAVYQALGAAARPDAIPTLEAGLRHAHPACVLAAAEALGAPFGRPLRTFEILLTFWELLDAWGRERPQLRSDVGFDTLVDVVKGHLRALSGETFAGPVAAREWFTANRRHVGRR
ncbi:MAG: HEAT repeat domain-containing protein [Planctomycetes bacterium]|nr:HEAT repeat domain-containing protein [Planctomycetota bacterium]